MDNLHKLLKMKVWTTHAPWNTKCPFDLIDHCALKNRQHLLTYSQIKTRVPHQQLMFAFNANDTHLLRLDLEKDADPLWKNLVLNLPCAYFEYSQHGGIHALLPITDQQLQKYPKLFKATNIKLGKHHDLELFPNDLHFMNFTGKSFKVNAKLNPQDQTQLVNNFLKIANQQVRQTVELNVNFSSQKLSQPLINFANFVYRMLYTKSNLQVFVKRTTQRYTKSNGDYDFSSIEFAIINKIQQNLKFWSKCKQLELNQNQFITLSVLLTKQILTENNLQRDKWNKSINGYDYLTWSNLKALQTQK